ncbi:MAG: CRISPR-associated endonuclease Cas3'', partial [Promethearchaeota archaeon]
MLIEFDNYYKHFPQFPEPSNEILYFSSFFAILLHDLGKINPYFQYRMVLPNKKRAFLKRNISFIRNRSIHSLLSALFGIALFKSLEFEETPLSRILLNSEFKFIVLLSILAHHSRTLHNLDEIYFICQDYPNMISMIL